MKASTAVVLGALSGAVQAFPALPESFDSSFLSEISNVTRQAPSASSSAAVPFSTNQLVDVTGIHAFQAPGPNDARGPCPGLNAMANHGYLPHSGVATIPQFLAACQTVFGMGFNLATVLSAYGALLDGPVAGWSIGGGEHTGIGGSHGNYESDSSPVRGDLYQYGSNSDAVTSQFKSLYNLQPDASTANYDLSVLRTFREQRFNESVEGNPKFYYPPFAGVGVTQAAFSFIYRFMSNKSEEYPEGKLDQYNLKSFFSFTGDGDDLTWVPGNERIPENWYTRNSNDQYDFPGLGTDLQYLAANDARIAQPGCNTGTTNTYTAINITAMTSGAYTTDSALADPICFALAVGLAEATELPLGPLGIALDVVDELVLPVLNLLGCVTVPSLNESVAEACPGYGLFGGPTAAIAPGAVQN